LRYVCDFTDDFWRLADIWKRLAIRVVVLLLCELGHGLPIEPRLLGHFGVALELGEAAMASYGLQLL
jgi:hypothetical protein